MARQTKVKKGVGVEQPAMKEYTVELPDQMVKGLKKVGRELGLSEESVIKRAVAAYLFKKFCL